MRNWKTTVAATFIAFTTLQLQLNAGAALLDWTTWILPVLIQVFGFLVKDAGMSDVVKLIALFCGLSFVLPSCTLAPGANGQPTFKIDAVALADFVNDWMAKNGAKDSTVEIVATPKGDAIVATMPDGKIVTEIINPSNVIVPQAVPVIK